MRYMRYSTANDVMKEFMIYGAKLTEMGFPKLLPVQAYPTDTIDFRSGLARTAISDRFGYAILKNPQLSSLSLYSVLYSGLYSTLYAARIL